MKINLDLTLEYDKDTEWYGEIKADNGTEKGITCCTRNQANTDLALKELIKQLHVHLVDALVWERIKYQQKT